MEDNLQPGQRLARGVSRHLLSLGFRSVHEFVPARGLRVDVMALGPKGEIWVIECKSSRADFMSDHKWTGYVEWCDRYFWCVDSNFPIEILPEGTGVIIADDFDAHILQYGPETKLAPARRKKLTLSVARTSMIRLQSKMDPTLQSKFAIDSES